MDYKHYRAGLCLSAAGNLRLLGDDSIKRDWGG